MRLLTSKEQIRIGDLTFEVQSAKAVRWAIGSSDSPRSSAWRMWGNKKGDVYLSVRSLGGILKTSFHRDRKCHTGFTSSYADTARENFEDVVSRHVDEWTLPDEPVVRAVQVLVPASELRVFDSREANQTKWMPTPAQNSASVVSVFLAKREAVRTWPGSERGALPLGIVMTPVWTAWAVFIAHQIDDDTRDWIEQLRSRMKSSARAAHIPREAGTRAVLGGVRKERDRFLLELAWD